MSFTVEDFHDLLRLLEQHPEWRAELRRHLLPDDLLELPALVRRLAEQVEQLVQAQARTEHRLEAALNQLAEAQVRTEQRLDRLEAIVERLAEAQARTEQRLDELVIWQRGEAGRREGESYERHIRRRAVRLFAGGEGGAPEELHVQRRLQEVLAEVLDQDESEEADPTLADLVWWKDGRFAVAEVSLTAGPPDVQRAHRRAETLRRAGLQALGVVIGRAWLDQATRQQADSLGVAWWVGDDLSPSYQAYRRTRV